VSSVLSNTLKEQIETTDSVIRELLGSDMTSAENGAIITSAQESALDAYGDMLVAHEKELIVQLQNLVIEYSAKIAANRKLQRLIGREIGRREVLRERIEAGEHI